MTNDTITFKHRCVDGEALLLDGTWKPLADEVRAECDACGVVYADTWGVEHQ
jgi:hypothetical protein